MLGTRLKQLREEQKKTQADLALYIGFDKRQVQRWEKNEASPSSETLKTLAIYLNVSADYLLGRVEDSGQMWADNDLTPDEYQLVLAYRRGEIQELMRLAIGKDR